MVKRWLPTDHRFICFIDNSPKLQGKIIDGTPVLSLDQALLYNLDTIVIAVLNREAASAIRDQIESAGFYGRIFDAGEVRRFQDIRVSMLRLLSERIHAEKIPGAVAELGVYQGGFASEINALFPEREQYYFDTFTGFDDRDLENEPAGTGSRHCDFTDTSVDFVKKRLRFPAKAHLIPGYFPDSTSDIPELAYALVSIDPDLYAPTLAGLAYFWPRISPGGVILIHDYTSLQFPGVRKAVDEFSEPRHIYPIPLMDLHGTAVLIRQGDVR